MKIVRKIQYTSNIITKIATQIGKRKEKINIPKIVAQVKMPGITSRVLWTILSFGFLVFGSGKLNILVVH
jgi:hypothetical protein